MVILLLAYLMQLRDVKRKKYPVISSVMENLILEKQSSTIL